MNKPTDADVQKVAWPKEDEIRWVEWRIGERETIAKGRMPDFDKRGNCDLVDYHAWLLHERDHCSFQKIGDQLFPNCNEPDARKMRADRAHDRVEGEFNRGHRKRVAKPPIQIPMFDPFI